MTRHFTSEEIRNFTDEQKQLICDQYIYPGLKEWYLMVNIYKYIVLNCFCAFLYPMVLYHTHKLVSKQPENIYFQGFSFWPNVWALFSVAIQLTIFVCWISSQLHGYAVIENFTSLHIISSLAIFLCVSCCYSAQSFSFTRAKARQMRIFGK